MVEYCKLASMVTSHCLICSLAGKPVAPKWPRQGTRLIFKHALSGTSIQTQIAEYEETEHSEAQLITEALYFFISN